MNSPESEMNQIRQSVRRFVKKNSKLLGEVDLTDTAKIFSSGLLDSLAFVALTQYIEDEFDIRLSDTAELTVERVDTLDQIVDLVWTGISRKKS